MAHVLVLTIAHAMQGGINFQTVLNLNVTHWETATVGVHVSVQTIAHVLLDGMLQIVYILIATH